jgi:flagellar hook protein FlgE
VARAEFSDMYAAALSGQAPAPIGIGTRLCHRGPAVHAGQHLDHLEPDGHGHQRRRLLPADRRQSPIVYSRNGQFKVDRERLHRQQQDIYVGLPLADPTVAPVLLTTTAVKFNASGTQPVDATTGLPVTDLSAVPLWAGALPPQFGTVSPTLDLSGMTAFASSFAVSDLTQDGYAPGSLQSINVAKNGDVEAIYTNGETLVSGTVILTAFRNPQGLRPVGDNAWVQTGTEGEAVRDKPGNGSFGVLQSGALEGSNIDLTGELVNMITAQRIYQANAQTIKTQDQVLQTLVNLR